MEKQRTEISKSFTLIELLIVIAVIAILAAMLLPALNSAREKAKVMACLNNHKQFGYSFTMYADDYKGYWPNNNRSGAHIGRDKYVSKPGKGWFPFAYIRLLGYLKTTTQYFCPVSGYLVENKNNRFMDSQVKAYPMGTDPNNYYFTDYVYIGPYNFYYIYSHGLDNHACGPLGPAAKNYSNGLKAKPSRDVLLVDKSSTPITSGESYPTGPAGYYSNHSKNGNHVFADGHAETVPFKEMTLRYFTDKPYHMKFTRY